MTLLIAVILLDHVDASWGSYVATVFIWLAHLAWHDR
jgi:hypothetical protein